MQVRVLSDGPSTKKLMEKFWGFIYYKYCKMLIPFCFIESFFTTLLWDMYWYKHVVPKKFGRPYMKTPFMQRCHNAWWIARHGDS